MRNIYIYVDDSGVLHPHAPGSHFIYAGYVFIDNRSKNNAKRVYHKAASSIQKHLELEGELKAAKMTFSSKKNNTSAIE